jgi:hypothetical protein
MVVGWWNVIATFRLHSTPANLAQQVSALFYHTRGFASHQRSSHEETKQPGTHVCVKFFLCFGSTEHASKIWPPFAQTSCVLYSCLISIKLKDDDWTRLQIECSVTSCTESYVHVTVHRDMWPCIVTNFLIIKPTRCINFSNLFWNETRHVSDSSSAHHQELAESGWNCSSNLILLLESCLQTCMTYTIAECTVNNSWWLTEELCKTCRVSFQNKFENLAPIVGFIIRELCTDFTKAFYASKYHMVLWELELM